MPAATSRRICCCRSFHQADAMALGERPEASGTAVLQMLVRRDVLAGLMFVGVALFGLWLSRDYPIGTALRMGTGYVPRLLCWILLGLGAVVLVQGLRAALASEASGQRGNSIVRAPDTRPEPGSSARDALSPRPPFDRAAHIGVHAQKEPGRHWIGVALAVGKLTATQMRGLAEVARDLGDGDIRLTVWQNLIISGVPSERIAAAQAKIAALGLSTSANSIRAGLIACTGNVGCKFAA